MYHLLFAYLCFELVLRMLGSYKRHIRAKERKESLKFNVGRTVIEVKDTYNNVVLSKEFIGDVDYDFEAETTSTIKASFWLERCRQNLGYEVEQGVFVGFGPVTMRQKNYDFWVDIHNRPVYTTKINNGSVYR